MKSLFRVASVLFVVALAVSVVGSASANNTWAVGNLVGLCAGTHIYQGPGGGYPYHTIVPEDNWTVKVIDGPRYFDGEPWWDTSRFAAGDPSGGTGWVKQSEADSCFGGGSGGGGGGGGDDPRYTNPFNDPMSTRPIWNGSNADFPSMLISDGFQWPMTSYTIGKYVFDYPDSWCPGVHHANDFISGTENAPIYSIGRGIVKLVKEDIRTNDKGEKIGYGLYIVVWHKAPNGEDVYALYSHLWPGTALVKENQKVERGDQIARQDTSGGARGTPHLHFEIRHPGDKGLFDIPGCPATREEAEKYYYNPLEYISKYWWENRPRVETSLPIEAARSASTVSDSVVVQQGNLNQGQQTGVYEFVITTIDKLWDLVVSFFGSAVEVTVYRPDGSVYGVYQIEKPPYMITVYDPEPGQWGYSLRAIDVPYDGYPFAVAVGTRSSPLPDVGDIIGDNPFENIEGDIAPPTTTIATEPISPNGKNGWFVSPISVTLTATDNSSGVGLFGVYYSLDDGHTYTTYSVPFVIATEGVTKLMYYSVDKLGNFEELHVIEYRLDMTPPVVSVWTDQSEYTRVQPFIDHFSGYDPEPGSGLASLLALFNNQPVTDGQVVDLFWLPLGTYTLTATGEDNAGWVTTNSKSITLIATIPSLQQAVNRLCAENYITKQGTCTSLSQKLASALSAQQRGQNKTAVNILLAFQNELKAQKGKAVTVQAYDLLMMDSNYVIQVLGGK